MKFKASLIAAILLMFSSSDIVSRDAFSEHLIMESATELSAIPVSYMGELFERFPVGSFSRDAFEQALTGLYHVKGAQDLKRTDIITLIDFSKPSTEERLFVIDLKSAKVLFQSLVAHGRNTGENMAGRFSNIPESYQSSLGFFITAETYHGKHGLSLRLDGLEPGINDNARARAIVVHGADYVSEEFAKAHGRLGRSQGCPALPRHLTGPIIEAISGGSLLYIYAPQPSYSCSSALLKPADEAGLCNLLAFME
jgi:hypothetical protein